MSPEPGNLRLEAPTDMETWDKLDQARITQRVLLPGFDRLGRWPKWYHHTTPARDWR